MPCHAIACERLASSYYDAVQAWITRDRAYAERKEHPDELLYGHAGTLYLLRNLRLWVLDSAVMVDESIWSITEAIVSIRSG